MPQCEGTTQKRLRCKNRITVPGRNLCHFHVKCCGNRRDGKKCGSRAKAEFDWLYCRADHDPRLPTSTPTSVFRVEELRESKGGIVKEYREYQDVYANVALLPGKHYYEMDHVVEIHLVRDAYDAVPLQGTKFKKRKAKLLLSLKDAVNTTENLAFTSPSINKSKFEAIEAFQNDYKQNSGRQLEEGLFPYLQDELQKGREWSRSVSRNVQKEFLASSEKILDTLQDEDYLQNHVIDTLHKNFTAMKLY